MWAEERERVSDQGECGRGWTTKDPNSISSSCCSSVLRRSICGRAVKGVVACCPIVGRVVWETGILGNGRKPEQAKQSSPS